MLTPACSFQVTPATPPPPTTSLCTIPQLSESEKSGKRVFEHETPVKELETWQKCSEQAVRKDDAPVGPGDSLHDTLTDGACSIDDWHDAIEDDHFGDMVSHEPSPETIRSTIPDTSDSTSASVMVSGNIQHRPPVAQHHVTSTDGNAPHTTPFKSFDHKKVHHFHKNPRRSSTNPFNPSIETILPSGNMGRVPTSSRFSLLQPVPPSGASLEYSSTRSPRKTFGAVWRASSSSPARQLGAWLHGRRSKFGAASVEKDRHSGADVSTSATSTIDSKDQNRRLDGGRGSEERKMKDDDCGEKRRDGGADLEPVSKRLIIRNQSEGDNLQDVRGKKRLKYPKRTETVLSSLNKKDFFSSSGGGSESDKGTSGSHKGIIRMRSDKRMSMKGGSERREVKSWCDERLARLIQGLQSSKSEDSGRSYQGDRNSSERSGGRFSGFQQDLLSLAGSTMPTTKSDCSLTEKYHGDRSTDSEFSDRLDPDMDEDFRKRFLLGYCLAENTEDTNANHPSKADEAINVDTSGTSTLKRKCSPVTTRQDTVEMRPFLADSRTPSPTLCSSSSEASPLDAYTTSNSDNVNNNNSNWNTSVEDQSPGLPTRQQQEDLLFSHCNPVYSREDILPSTSEGTLLLSSPDSNILLSSQPLDSTNSNRGLDYTPHNKNLPSMSSQAAPTHSIPRLQSPGNVVPPKPLNSTGRIHHHLRQLNPMTRSAHEFPKTFSPVGAGSETITRHSNDYHQDSVLYRRSARLAQLARSGRGHLSSPACDNRLCNVTITRLHMLAPPPGDLSSVIVAVKMHSSKRTLRSNELPLPPSGALDAELQLCYSLQYPHFLKREGNSLHILLQRRKRYKNRTILGFKTLAVGIVNMAQVLQRPMDRELDLYSQGKEGKGAPVARVTLEALSSQPVDCDEAADSRLLKTFLADNPDRSVDIAEDSDDDPDYSSQDDGSDSEPMLDDAQPHHHHHRHHRQGARAASLPPTARQRNLKQRFIALLKKFKVPEALQAFEADPDLDPRTDVPVDPDDIEYLMNELEDLSDSGPEVDTISISSTPKPSLRPYFSSSRSLLADDGAGGSGVPRLRLPDKPSADHMSDESSKRDSDHPLDYPTDSWTDAELSADQQPSPALGIIPSSVGQTSSASCTPIGGCINTVAGLGGSVSSPPTGVGHGMLSSPENGITGGNAVGGGGSGAASTNGGVRDANSSIGGGEKCIEKASSGTTSGSDKDRTNSITGGDRGITNIGGKPSHKSSKSIGSGAGALMFGGVGSRSDKRTISTSSSSGPGPGEASSRQDSQISSESTAVRKGLLEQLSSLLPSDDFRLPQSVILLDASDFGSSFTFLLQTSSSQNQTATGREALAHGFSSLCCQLAAAGLPVIHTVSPTDVRAAMQHLVHKLQKFCNSNAKSPGPMKVVMVGSDTYINSVLRPYVADFSTKPPDFQNHIRFLIVPLGGVSSLAKYLGSVDSAYGESFLSEWWREAVNRWDAQDVQEAVTRITRYLREATHTIHLPVAEAVLTYKEKSSDDESSQTFIPFVTDVRLGSGDVTSTSLDLDEPPVSATSSSSTAGPPSTPQGQSSCSQPSSTSNLSTLANLSMLTTSAAAVLSGGSASVTTTASSGAGSMGVGATSGALGGTGSAIGSPGSLGSPQTGAGLLGGSGAGDNSSTTPPSSPNINTSHLPTSRTLSESEALELQVDYWQQSRAKDRDREDRDRDGGSKSARQDGGGRCTLKTSFRTLQVARLAPLGIVLPPDTTRDGGPPPALTFSYATKENKKRIMRLGKKKERERESESRRDVVDGVTRVLANTRAGPVTVTIDSVEWPNVKFFQLSSQWQTQIKTFPVGLFNLQSLGGGERT